MDGSCSGCSLDTAPSEFSGTKHKVFCTPRLAWRLINICCSDNIPGSKMVWVMANKRTIPAFDTCIALPAWAQVVARPGQGKYDLPLDSCSQRSANELVGMPPVYSVVTGMPCKESISFRVNHRWWCALMINVALAVNVIIAFTGVDWYVSSYHIPK